MTDTTTPPATPTRASFFARAKKSFVAAGAVLVTNVGADLPGIFANIGLQTAGQNPAWGVLIWTDLGIMVSTVGGAFFATWRATNAKVDGTPNLDSHAPAAG